MQVSVILNKFKKINHLPIIKSTLQFKSYLLRYLYVYSYELISEDRFMFGKREHLYNYLRFLDSFLRGLRYEDNF